MKDGAGLLRAIDAGQLRAMGQPVEAGQNGDGEIRRRGAGEIDHGVAMRTLGEIGVDHLDLPGGRAQQLELAARAPPSNSASLPAGCDPRRRATSPFTSASVRLQAG